jgi:malonate transporter and related proteins
MLSTLAIVLPIFALVLAGWIVRRIGVLGPNATGELNRFVVYLALPALLFQIVASAKLQDIWRPAFIGAFGAGCMFLFGLTAGVRALTGRRLADAAVDGLNAGYANVGFIGFPLALAALGQQALAPALIATIVTVCAVFAVAIVLIELDLQGGGRIGPTLGKVGLSLARNPLIVAPILGAVFPVTGWAEPLPLAAFFKLLAGSASPCALVALGLFMAQKRPAGGAPLGTVAALTALKLLGQPVVTWLLAAFVFRLPPPLVRAAVLLAALPTGTGPFMLAEFYRREADVTARVILASTVLSIVTVSAYLAWTR